MTENTAKESVQATAVWIDDDIDSTHLWTLILERRLGVKVIGTAPNAESGRPLVIELQPKLIFLDHMMPGISGIPAIHYMRAAAPEAKLIFRTYLFPDPNIVNQALEAGADRVVSYGPMRIDEMATVVREVLDGLSKT